MKQLFLFILIPFVSFSQQNDFEKIDSIVIDGKSYSTYFFNMEKNSILNLAKVFVAKNKDFKEIMRKIPEIYSATKQEFTDFYLISLESMESQVIEEYLNSININRIKRNKPILSLDNNVHVLKSADEICKYMFCPN